MKKFLLITLLLLGSALAFARPGSPMMGVERVRWWDAEYLTVTWGGAITPYWQDSSRNAREYIVSLLDSPTKADQSLFYDPADEDIYTGSRVLAVDGMDAKGWSPDRFYSAIDGTYRHTLKQEHPGVGVYEVTLGRDLPAWMTAAGFHPGNCIWKNSSYNQLPDGYKIRMDKDVNWRGYKTYDYYFSSDDVLADKELFETICKELEVHGGLKRNEENPDIVFTIVKDANQSIDYTYVPETIEHVQTGSSSCPVYGWKGQYLGSVTTNNLQTYKSGGYTQKTATTTAYLEIDILEASRLGQKTLPLIWQLKFNYNQNKEADIDKLYSNAVTWFDWPIYTERQQKTSITNTRYFYGNIPLYDFGIVLGADATVLGVDPKSDVVKDSGIKVGDVVKALDVTRSRSFNTKSTGYKYSGSISVERNGQNKNLSFSGCTRTKNYGVMTFAAGHTNL